VVDIVPLTKKLVIKERSIVEMTTASYTTKLFNVKAEEETRPLPKAANTKLVKLPILNERVTLGSPAYEIVYLQIYMHVEYVNSHADVGLFQVQRTL
jgi:hypothetical protein